MKLLLFWLLLHIRPCFSKILVKKASNSFDCLKSLTESWWSPTAVIISENDDLLHNIVHFPIRILTSAHAKRFFDNVLEKPNSYIILPKSLSSLEDVLQDLVESQAFRVSTYMVVTTFDVDVQSVAELMWSFRLPSTLLIQKNSNTADLSIYSTHIVDCGARGEAQHIIDLPANFVCPSKLKIPQFSFKQSFIGCPLKVLWVRSPPYMYPANNTWGWKGIYMDSMDALQQLSGRKIVPMPDDIEYFQDVATALAYDSVIGAMENETQLFMGSGELGLGELFDVSTIISDGYLKIIAPRLLTNHWKKFSSTMTVKLFIIGCATSVVVVTLTYCFNNFGFYEKTASDHLSIAQIILLLFSNFVGTGGFGKLSTNSSLRLLFGFLILSLMVINLFLQGSLISLLTGSMYDKPILSLDQLIESGIDIKMTAMLKSFLKLADSKNKKLITILSRAENLQHIEFEEIIDQLIREKNFATFTLEALILMRPNIEKSFSSFTYITVHSCWAMKKNDYSSPPLYNWILTIVESGFLVKFEKLQFHQLALKFSVDTETNPYIVSLRQFWPVMVLLFSGLATSAVGLVFEYFYYMFSKLLITRRPAIE